MCMCPTCSSVFCAAAWVAPSAQLERDEFQQFEPSRHYMPHAYSIDAQPVTVQTWYLYDSSMPHSVCEIGKWSEGYFRCVVCLHVYTACLSKIYKDHQTLPPDHPLCQQSLRQLGMLSWFSSTPAAGSSRQLWPADGWLFTHLVCHQSSLWDNNQHNKHCLVATAARNTGEELEQCARMCYLEFEVSVLTTCIAAPCVSSCLSPAS